MAGYFGKENDSRPLIIVPERSQVSILQPTTTSVKPLDNEAGNTEITFNKTPLYSDVTLIVPRNPVKPLSIAHEPWTGFGSLENRIFIDDFCHEKNLTVKVQANTHNGSTIKLKEAATWSGKKEPQIKDEVKLWFPLFYRLSSTLHFRLTSADTRIHYDHGLQNWGQNKVNIYGSFGFLRDWSQQNYKLGLALVNKNATIDHRLKIDSNKVFTLYHRTSAFVNEWRFGVVAALDLTNVALVKKDLLVGYAKNNIDVTLKAQQAWDKKTEDYQNLKEWFNTLTLTSVFTRNTRERYGLELVAHPRSKRIVGTALVEYKYNNKSFTRIKLNSEFNLTFLIKNVLTQKLAFSFGASVPLQKKEGNNNKFGAQLDFNI